MLSPLLVEYDNIIENLKNEVNLYKVGIYNERHGCIFSDVTDLVTRSVN